MVEMGSCTSGIGCGLYSVSFVPEKRVDATVVEDKIRKNFTGFRMNMASFHIEPLKCEVFLECGKEVRCTSVGDGGVHT